MYFILHHEAKLIQPFGISKIKKGSAYVAIKSKNTAGVFLS